MSGSASREYVTVGRVVKPHGIRGEFCIVSYADSPLLFDEVPAVWLQTDKGKPSKFKIKSWREHKKQVLMVVQGVADRNRAEELRGADVLVLAKDLPDLEDDQVYLYQLVGFAVTLEDGSPVGELTNFLETPGQDTWIITGPDDREILFPAVAELVLDIDLDSETIVIDPPEGLLELFEPQPEGDKKPKKKRRSKPRRKTAKKKSD